MMDDLVRWLGEQLDEDERIARQATDGPWIAEVSGETGNCVIPADAQSTREYVAKTQLYAAVFDAEHIARHNPARALRQVEATRKLLDTYTTATRLRDEAAARIEAANGEPDAKDGDTWLGWQREVAALELPVRLAASAYTDRHTFREEWAP
ncbi:DUF6221 family protein [Streptomyces phaeochromogenes]|uniref:DUF6221 family protein n=1 Tax=Streptomyces phaeochromogenes TaxID=1923 RepID=UPI00224F1F53|nr:DUF6221 family protein [Streptomyces phaeochromogenes]MCX5598487.1 DUF6221 family protein [Streptomyces phaeochromogenes]